jgi:hypothetical protein
LKNLKNKVWRKGKFKDAQAEILRAKRAAANDTADMLCDPIRRAVFEREERERKSVQVERCRKASLKAIRLTSKHHSVAPTTIISNADIPSLNSVLVPQPAIFN